MFKSFYQPRKRLGPVMKDFVRVMKALSNSNRARILKLLQHKALCVYEITDIIKLAQSSVSTHLKILENAGLVTSRKRGLWVHYKLSDGADNPYAAALLGNLKHWLNESTEIDRSKIVFSDSSKKGKAYEPKENPP